MVKELNRFLESFEELLRADPGPGVDRQLHLRDLLVNLLHEVNDEVHEFVAQHDLRVEVCDQEAYIVALNFFPPKDDEVLCSAHHKLSELVGEKFLDLVRLLYRYGHSNRIDGRFNKDPLLLVSGDNHGVQQ